MTSFAFTKNVLNIFFHGAAFSLASYGAAHSLDLAHLSEVDLVYLYDYLGISTYLSPATCNRSSELYLPANDGWSNGN